MKLIEFRNEVSAFNNRNEVYKIVLDESFKLDMYNSMKVFPGIFATPYIVDGNFIMAYYVNDASLIPYLEYEAKLTSSVEVKIPVNLYKKLFKEKVQYGNLLLCPENLIYEVKYLRERSIILNTEYYKKFRGRGIVYTGITNLLNKVQIDNFNIIGKGIQILESVAKDFSKNEIIQFTDLFEYGDKPQFFNLNKNRLILDVEGVISLYKGYLTKLECLYDMKYLDNRDTAEVNREIKDLVYNLVRMHNCVKHYNFSTTLYDLLESLCDIKRFKDARLENNRVALMLLGEPKAVSGLLVPLEVIKYARADINLQNYLTKVSSEEVDIADLQELRGFVSYINTNRKEVSLYLDVKASKDLYYKSRKLLGVIPYPVYLKNSNKFVICYECLEKASYEKLVAYTRKLEPGKLTKTLVKRLTISSYRHIDSCVFKPTVYRTYKYLHRVGVLDSTDLLIEGRSCLVRNMRDLLSVVPLNDIVSRENILYFKLPGLYKPRGFQHKVKYDRSINAFYTIVKINLYSWQYIDTLLGALEFFGDYTDSKEFSTLAGNMLEDVLLKINRKQKFKDDLETLEEVYLQCTKNNQTNLLTETINRMLIDKVSSLAEEKLKSKLNLEYIRQELELL